MKTVENADRKALKHHLEETVIRELVVIGALKVWNTKSKLESSVANDMENYLSKSYEHTTFNEHVLSEVFTADKGTIKDNISVNNSFDLENMRE